MTRAPASSSPPVNGHRRNESVPEVRRRLTRGPPERTPSDADRSINRRSHPERRPPMRPRHLPFVRIALAVFAIVTAAGAADDPLPSWNDGPAKAAIVRFVGDVTRQGGSRFVPVEERIAVFD